MGVARFGIAAQMQMSIEYRTSPYKFGLSVKGRSAESGFEEGSSLHVVQGIRWSVSKESRKAYMSGRFNWHTFAVLALLAVFPVTCNAQYHDLDPDLAQAAKDYDKAQIEGDRAALDRLVANDYLIIRSNGNVGDKSTLLEVVAGKRVKNDPYVVEKPFQRVYGDTVILGGWVHLTATDNGKRVQQNARFADTWSKRNGKWQVVFTCVVLADKP